jgi:FkbM family methyltransferase
VNTSVKMFFRTVQINFPFLLDAKFSLMRRYRNYRGIPFDRDFDGIRLFPIADGAVFLDVGANRGQSTDAILMMARNSRVHLFEPNPLLCQKLVRQFAPETRIEIHGFGLGNQASDQPLFIPFYKRWMFDGLASFDRDKARSWLDGRMLFYKEDHVALREVTCRIRRLDELHLAPFFIKLDVQGYEFEAILGGEHTIRNHEPVLLIESPPEERIIAFLKPLGYQFYTFRHSTFVRGIAEGNNTYFMTGKTSSLVSRHIAAVP